MANTKRIPFRNFITLQRGFDLPKKEMRDGPYPVVGSTSIIGYHDEYKVKPPGVVTGRSGSLGLVQYVKDEYWPHNTALWVKDFRGNHPKYVYYYLQTLNLQRFNSGAGVPTLNRNDLDTLEVEIHLWPAQRKIAAILSAYDDLIENNTRRITILEETARLIYREWFVHFRFPGHEKIRILDSQLGPIPEDWRVACLDELFHNESGIVLTGPFGSKLHASDYRNVGVPLILVKHVKDGNIVEEDLPLVGEHKLDELERYRLRSGDIVVTRVGFVGESAYIHPHHQNWLFSGQMLRVRVPTKDVIHPHYLAQYYLTPAFKKMIENFAVGATRLSLNTEILSAMLLPVPPIGQQLEFVRLISPIDALAQSLRLQNANLSRTRDLLLPKLMSGEVAV
jgi:type I restriction enzyme S subunit